VAYIPPFIPPWTAFSCEAGKQLGSLRSLVQGDWLLSSNTHSIREKAFCFTAVLTSNSDLAAVPAFPEAPG